MTKQTTQPILEHVSTDLNSLPAEDLELVTAFVTSLKQRQTVPMPRLDAVAMRIEAQRRAAALRDVPRAELVTRFQAVADDIRQQAIAQGTAIAGDWEGDEAASGSARYEWREQPQAPELVEASEEHADHPAAGPIGDDEPEQLGGADEQPG